MKFFEGDLGLFEEDNHLKEATFWKGLFLKCLAVFWLGLAFWSVFQKVSSENEFRKREKIIRSSKRFKQCFKGEMAAHQSESAGISAKEMEHVIQFLKGAEQSRPKKKFLRSSEEPVGSGEWRPAIW